MPASMSHFVTEAQKAAAKGRHADAGYFYEKAAEMTRHQAQAAKLFKKAFRSFADAWRKDDAERCLQRALELMDGNQKAMLLVECWKDMVDTIVHFEYDCSFEWRGETDGSHDSYLNDLSSMQQKATGILRRALEVEGVDRDFLLEEARGECRKREAAGGWGSARCWDTIRDAAH